ncbi:amidohydrolase family protein [Candidatus Poriferisocius sp.]|uniref:amidohydrolase family protein n=1 Tax=Candidatus Poriferisocius sp. TaxID=3101276 RepID=UPI003B58E701
MTETFEFVDAHVHFWDHSVEGLRWVFLERGFDHPRLRGMHRLDAPAFTDVELTAQAGPYIPSRVIHVQSCEEDAPGLESAWVQSMADERPMIGAIVARARVAAPEVNVVLAANACQPAYRGVRDMASPQTIGTPEFTAGFDAVAASGSSLEVLVPYPKYRDVGALAVRHPETQIVLGHAGLAEHRDPEYFKAWSAELAQFGILPNVTVKISALASGADPNWTEASIRPWILRCVEVFGPDRAMFGSNWPIDRLYGDYERVIDAYRGTVAELGRAEQAALFIDTATRVYKLTVN